MPSSMSAVGISASFIAVALASISSIYPASVASVSAVALIESKLVMSPTRRRG
ncbi:MAG: hypothetical protein J6B23_06705 [Clostridia bacterium]|nr:hypothetical protein [Clostridia bacterium]